MDHKQSKAIWEAFEKAINEAESADARSTAMAIKAFADLFNTRMANIEMALSVGNQTRANPPK